MTTANLTRSVGTGRFRYRPVEQWERLPDGWSFVEVAGVATDSADRVYVFNRGEHPVCIFDRDGAFITSWGEGVIARAHGIFIGPDDAVYLTDDLDHTVRKFTPEGKLLLTLGTSGQPSETGITEIDYRTIKQPGPPFNRPTNLALGASGTMYVTDGYGNSCVHKFSPDGKLLLSWGLPGSGPGEFNLPHGIAVDSEERVWVADRENSRLQIFDSEGRFLDQWTDVARPMQVSLDREDNVYVAEVGWHAGRFPWQTPPPNGPKARVSVFNPSGQLQARWGGGDDPCAAGDFFAPHDLWVDSRGDVYVGEVMMSAGGYQGKVPSTCHSLQKFVREPA